LETCEFAETTVHPFAEGLQTAGSFRNGSFPSDSPIPPGFFCPNAAAALNLGKRFRLRRFSIQDVRNEGNDDEDQSEQFNDCVLKPVQEKNPSRGNHLRSSGI
jgi:hypothetical protein